MRIYDIIRKKRDGKKLSQEEIEYFIDAYTKGNIEDYQASALLMSIFINEMDEEETLYLTKAMVNSGDTVDLSKINGIKVDKHSTGGVGDSVTLIIGPMVAACGVPFVKMSGRGLGHTGGTLDKLESIEGFNVNLSSEEFIDNANQIKLVLSSQTNNITPADKKIYALRDVTATVDNLSLISSSIMSKKLAIESDGIILDVKVGSGAFMKTVEEAKELASEMVKIGKNYGRETKAIITNMDQPLGKSIGNALEVKEAIEVLKGNGPEDIREISMVLGSKLLVMAKKVDNEEAARNLLEATIDSGEAIMKLKEMIKYQGGNPEVVDKPELLPKANYVLEVISDESGYVKEIDAEKIGETALLLGAGRETKDSIIDLSAGIVLNKKVDDRVMKGDVLAYIHSNDIKKGNMAIEKIKDIYIIGEENSNRQKLILGEID